MPGAPGERRGTPRMGEEADAGSFGRTKSAGAPGSSVGLALLVRSCGSSAAPPSGEGNFEDVDDHQRGHDAKRSSTPTTWCTPTGVSGPSWMFDGNVSMQAAASGGSARCSGCAAKASSTSTWRRRDRIFGRRAAGGLRRVRTCSRVPEPSPNRIPRGHGGDHFHQVDGRARRRVGAVRPAARLEGGGDQSRGVPEHGGPHEDRLPGLRLPAARALGAVSRPIEQMFDMVISGKGRRAVAMEQAAHALTVYLDDIMREMQEAQGR